MLEKNDAFDGSGEAGHVNESYEEDTAALPHQVDQGDPLQRRLTQDSLYQSAINSSDESGDASPRGSRRTVNITQDSHLGVSENDGGGDVKVPIPNGGGAFIVPPPGGDENKNVDGFKGLSSLKSCGVATQDQETSQFPAEPVPAIEGDPVPFFSLVS